MAQAMVKNFSDDGVVTEWKRADGDAAPPFLSWCLIVRNAEATLEATLRSIRELTPTAEIVVVDTMSRDRSSEIARRYADVWVEWAGPRGDWDREMPWFDDAAAARQHAFELASGRWRGWIDSDDVLPGAPETERLLRLNNRWMPAPAGSKVEGAGERTSLEDLLRRLEAAHPDADCVWAPYLYQRDKDDLAVVWQDRERIVRWDPKRWRWAERAHEILVPDGAPPPRVYFDTLLFLHEKEFSPEETTFAVRRHYDVLLKQYDAGDVTTRRAQYLSWYARQLAPERELEFIEAAHRASTNSLDRYRTKVDHGNFFLARGLYHDALEQYGAATTLLPQLPDAWVAVVRAAEEFRDVARQIEAGERALLCESGQLESALPPRQHELEYAVRLAEAYALYAREHVRAGKHAEAVGLLQRALELEARVMSHPAIGPDADEARARCARAENALNAQKHAVWLGGYLQYLCDNDEPLKALATLREVPWNIDAHPIVEEWWRRLEVVEKHATDPEAYRAFYDDKGQTGAVLSPEEWLDPASPSVSAQRARWAATWINEHCPNGVIVDVGCFDGIVGIPLLRLCPGIKYIGVDVYHEALEEFGRRADRLGLAGRVELHEISVDDLSLEAIGRGGANRPSVVLWMELAEHVPDPQASLAKLLDIAPTVLVTTPWGSFDAGHPPPGGANGSVRDNRGHLRAYSPREFIRQFDYLDTRVVELAKVPGPVFSTGDSMVAEVQLENREERAVSFLVPGALWDWSGSTVRREGMGASEETIVYLAEWLARERHTQVFGPVPEVEVDRGVNYLAREDFNSMAMPNGKVVVSRAPSAARGMAAGLEKILWLQDASYPDLDRATADLYDHVVVVSEWHRQAMHERHGVPLSKMVVIPNFVLPEHFLSGEAPARKRDHFIYASSPDRGLVRLLEAWPRIRATLPEATLDIFYGWRGAARLSVAGQYGWMQRYESMRRRFEELRHQPGVTYRGMVDHVSIAREYQRAGVWLYPTKFEETCCTAAIKARAGGAVPICPPLAALAEMAKSDLTCWLRDVDDDEELVEQCLYATTVGEEERERMSVEAIATRGIANALNLWDPLLE